MTNKLNKTFVETIRNIGGNNETRYLLIASYCNRPDREAINQLEIIDEYCIVSIHYFHKYEFCLEKGINLPWNESYVYSIRETINYLNEKFISNNIPVIITEFGCIDKHNTDDRITYTKSFISIASQNKINCIWWDNGNDCGLINRREHTWKYLDIANQIVQK